MLPLASKKGLGVSMRSENCWSQRIVGVRILEQKNWKEEASGLNEIIKPEYTVSTQKM